MKARDMPGRSMTRRGLSARPHNRILKVSRTIVI